MTRALRGLAALTLLAVAPLSAQNPIADRMLNIAGKGYPEGGTCKLEGGDFHVGGAGTQLSGALAVNTAGPAGLDNKRRLLHEADTLARAAIRGGTNASSSKAWYYLGRINLQQGDLVGADTAFTKVVTLSPLCAAEVNLYRVRGWSILVSAAANHRSSGNADSAMFYARAATIIDPTRPQAWYAIGAGFLEKSENDSASAYFVKAILAPADTSENAKSIREAAAYQAAVLAYNKRDYTNAVRWFAEALRLKPDDSDAKRNLAASLRQAGMADSASKIEQSMMGAAAGSDAGLTVAQLFDIGVGQFGAGDFAGAAATFEKIVATEPNNRDALYNLAQSYSASSRHADSLLTTAQRAVTAHPRDTVAQHAAAAATQAQKDAADKLLATALKLQAIDPLSDEVTRLIGAGYRAKHDQANVLKTATAIGGATLSVKVTGFSLAATGATLTMTVTGREGRDLNDHLIPSAPIPIVVEFLDQAGTVVVSSDTTLPAPAAGAAQTVSVTGAGAGIMAWRYHRK